MTEAEHKHTDTPALIDADRLAYKLNCSKRTVYRLMNNNQLPPPVRLAGMVRWRETEVNAWIDAGCPAEVTK